MSELICPLATRLERLKTHPRKEMWAAMALGILIDDIATNIPIFSGRLVQLVLSVLTYPSTIVGFLSRRNFRAATTEDE